MRVAISYALGVRLPMLAAVGLGLLAPGRSGLLAAPPGPLAEYVGRADDSFTWKKVEERSAEDLTTVRLDCVSQTWRGQEWQHQLLVVRPAVVRNPDAACLIITGDGDVAREIELLRLLAQRAGAIAAVINRVPNQPFYGGRKEDALIAYTFDEYLKTGDPTWPLLFPMVKSAVRGMDAVQALAQKQFEQKVERFIVTGASKRGWTTWLSAAVDPRVQGIAPMVIDMLNMKAQTQWAEQMYGRQSEQIRDYTDLNLIARMDEPRMVELRSWVDPYAYRARYTMPKLLLLGTDDPYWVVDSLRHYWNDLPAPKLVFQTPNAGHDLAGGREAHQALAAFYQMVADRQTLPQMTWQFKTGSNKSVSVVVDLSPPAKAFRLWTATASVRDFRKARWWSTDLPVESGTHVVADVETPQSGFRAYLVEAELTSPTGQTYKLSTEARVTPDGPPGENAGADGNED